MSDKLPIAGLILLVCNLCVSFFLFNKKNIWVKFINLLFLSAYAVVAGLALYAVIQDTAGNELTQWSWNWFSFEAQRAVIVSLSLDSWTAFLWFLSALIFLIFETILLLRKKEETPALRIPLAIFQLGMYGAVLCGNITTLVASWALNSIALFLCIALSKGTKAETNDQSTSAYKFLFQITFADLIFLLGALSLSEGFGAHDFLSLATNLQGKQTELSIGFMLGGFMLRCFQFPFTNLAKLAALPTLIGPVMSILFCLFSGSTVLAKLLPVLNNETLLSYLSFIPALTCLYVGVMVFAEENYENILMLISSYLAAETFLAVLNEGYLSAAIISSYGSIALLLLLFAFSAIADQHKVRRVLIFIGCFALLGIPGTSVAQGKVLLYQALLTKASSGQIAPIVVCSFKVIADILLGLTCWKMLKTSSNQPINKYFQEELDWRVVLPITLLALFEIAVTSGTRIFSGFLMEMEAEISSKVSWLESWLGHHTTAHNIQINSAAQELTWSAVLMCLGILFVSAIISWGWILRDKNTIKSIEDKWRGVVSVVDLDRFLTNVVWNIVIVNVVLGFNKVCNFFELKIFSRIIRGLGTAVYITCVKVFHVFDRVVVDKSFVTVFGKSFYKTATALRLLQNGQVQFYLAFGIIVTLLILIQRLMGLGG